MTDVFISYASENVEKANSLRSALEKAGLICWIAPRDIPVGAEYGAEIIRGIENTKVFLLCLTKESNDSQHVAREVERAVNRNLPIITYQQDKITLNKSLEYFLASTQWFTDTTDGEYTSLVESVKQLLQKDTLAQKNSTDEMNAAESIQHEKELDNKNNNRFSFKAKIITLAIIGIVLTIIGCSHILLLSNNSTVVPSSSIVNTVSVHDSFTFGKIDYNGSSEELSWLVLSIDTEKQTALCLAQNIIAFQPFDVAESGNRGFSGSTSYQEESASSYTNEELQQFWGNSDWAASNIRTWLNSKASQVVYPDMAPVSDGTTIYENAYDTKPGFLYLFTEEEQNQLCSHFSSYTMLSGDTSTVEDKVFLLSKEEVTSLLTDQNLIVSALPTAGAIQTEGSGVYQSYADEGKSKSYWALRNAGNDTPACMILCAGAGLDQTADFHSEYACSSLIGIRPAIVVPLSTITDK